jgi:hypothetical protein
MANLGSWIARPAIWKRMWNTPVIPATSMILLKPKKNIEKKALSALNYSDVPNVTRQVKMMKTETAGKTRISNIPKVLIIVSAVILILLILFFTYVYVLAANHPFSAGHRLFPLQNYAENIRLRLMTEPVEKTGYLVEICEQRLLDLALTSGSPDELFALDFFNQSLDKLILSLQNIPADQAYLVRPRLYALLEQLNNVVFYLTYSKENYPDLYATFTAKIGVIDSVMRDPEFQLAGLVVQDGQISINLPALLNGSGNGITIPTPTPAGFDPLAVPFPPGSAGAQHAFFPLIGGHANLGCWDCHTGEQYSGLSPVCEACHLQDRPVEHYPGECVSCHTPESWQLVSFDHSLVGENSCTTCHLKDRPPRHYEGECVLCHSTQAWTPATFNHEAVNAVNCQQCHLPDRPANHYTGQCSLCHNTVRWSEANFNHSAVDATNCQQCHNSDKPANHFSGQCSLCHTTNAWRPASFNHSAMQATDCQACHLKDKPANHFDGQCSLCHNTSRWGDATFNHQAFGASDCQACHLKDKPANHFAGQCSACHGTGGWRPARFDHAAANATDCQACHLRDRPQNHFEGQCSQCHNTSNWNDASFNHRFPIDHKDADGDCSVCHPSGPPAWTCYVCHDRAKTIEKHDEKNITDIDQRCTDCHPDGDD